MYRIFTISIFFLVTSLLVSGQESRRVYLSGTGSDQTVDWDFYCTGGQNSGKWTTIPVPSNWELQGFGTYNYGHDQNKGDEKGLYRHTFFVPSNWKNMITELVFEGSMTDTEVKINGRSAGPVHQGAFYRFSYDITGLIKPGKDNLLEVTVSKMSSDASVNSAERDADYWVFGGIFRPVYLRVSPVEHIDRIAVNAKADGSFVAEIHVVNLRDADSIKVNITPLTIAGKSHTTSMAVDKKAGVQTVKTSIIKPELWSPEFPNLYTVKIDLIDGKHIIHSLSERFGFRTVEVKERDGIYLNGQKIMFRGVCRHSFWPTTGRALNKTLSIEDVELMKDMNMNAVRMSHYPPDVHFLDACDSIGLFVLDELAGWQKPPYNTDIGKKLVREMVNRDVNHPCIVLWDNGNENGWNDDLNDEFAKYDPQNRKIVHPREIFDGLNTEHYINWNYGQNVDFNGRDIFFPTEFLHGLYDGGHGAGLDDYWNLMLDRPLSAGGFLWDFSDEGVVRTDEDGRIDTRTNNAADGILGPYREKEGSFWSIREIWSPVHVDMENLPPAFNGYLNVENRFFFTNLDQCHFSLSLVSCPWFDTEKTGISYSITSPHTAAGMRGIVDLTLPENWRDFDILKLSAVDPHGRSIMDWSWPVQSPKDEAWKIVSNSAGFAATVEENEAQIILKEGNIRYFINKAGGLLDSVMVKEAVVPFGNGPVLAHEDVGFDTISWHQEKDRIVIDVRYNKGHLSFRWALRPGGWLQLDYRYYMKGEYPFAGIDFSFPESELKAVRYLGDGPYRVWKNRMKGPQFGMWDKNYNNTVTGESWDYPEFKGFYSRMYRAKFITRGQPFYVVSSTEDLFLRLFTPQPPAGAYNGHTSPPFPGGDISFLSAVSPIGTKFTPAEKTGPQGALNVFSPHSLPPYREGTLYFYFGEK